MPAPPSSTRPTSRRITQTEWRAINAALAYCTSGTPDDVSMTPEEFAAAAAVRPKVHERITADYYEDDDEEG